MSAKATTADLRQRKSTSSSSTLNSTQIQTSKPHELVRFIETDGHFSLVRNFHLADAFTLMNAFCGAQSLFASARYLVTWDPKHAWLALWFPFFGAIFDLLDGKVARWRKTPSMLGQELDSLADSLSFGAAPAFAAYALGLRLPIDSLVLTLFICAGVARLARFNVTAASVPHDAAGKARYFEGLPIPSSLALVGGMAFCLRSGRVESGGLAITQGVPLGTFAIDLSFVISKILVMLPGWSESHDSIKEWSLFLGRSEGHWISILWLLWAMAMVSKTLRVPKP